MGHTFRWKGPKISERGGNQLIAEAAAVARQFKDADVVVEIVSIDGPTCHAVIHLKRPEDLGHWRPMVAPKWPVEGWPDRPDPAQVIEVLKEASNLKEVGRNEKCPCGSGKKYKSCHLN